jgi:hypothetical protein
LFSADLTSIMNRMVTPLLCILLSVSELPFGQFRPAYNPALL